jgi:cytochrome c oxidase cbb3-type subunit 1
MSEAAALGTPPLARPDYIDEVIKKFTIATVFWGIVGFLVGVYIALELTWPSLNFGLSFLNFGRLRRQRAAGHLVLGRAANLPRPPVRRPRA